MPSLSNCFSVDILDAQNVYSIDSTNSKAPVIENVVIQFSKIPCSAEVNTKKCMGNTRNDQFNSKSNKVPIFFPILTHNLSAIARFRP